jgi:hypothetical protein
MREPTHYIGYEFRSNVRNQELLQLTLVFNWMKLFYLQTSVNWLLVKFC